MKRSSRQLGWRWVLMGALLMIVGATSAMAQNTFPSSGNVGIGTLSPKGALGISFNNDDEVVVYSPRDNQLAIQTTLDGQPLSTYGGPNNQLFLQPIVGNVLLATGGGNVGIGTLSPTTRLHVAGDVQVDGNLAAKYQDVAEWVPASSPLPPGTVVVVDPQQRNQVLPASQSYDTRVAGVVSAMPGLLLGEAGEGKVKVTQSGRVPVKVDASYGPIAVGDLLVTSPTLGHAMRSTPLNLGGTLLHRPGTLLGKALERLEEGRGEILVLLTLQ